MKKEYIFGVGGLIIGVLAALIVTIIVTPQNTTTDKNSNLSNTTHTMPDGTVMSNSHSGMTMDDMVNVLVGKSGDEFDKAFLEGMIEHHVGAVDMAELVFDNSKHQELKDMAQDIISAQTSEIEMMKQWQKDWGYVK